MARVEFDSTKKPLDDLLKRARDGQVQLPDFQRGWVWATKASEAFLRRYPDRFPSEPS